MSVAKKNMPWLSVRMLLEEKEEQMADGIVYQNKDILFKVLGQTYRNKSFSAYGIELPPIMEVLPTELPKISADGRSVDNLFKLEDGTYAIVDYESEYRRVNKAKYINYIARVMEKYFKEDGGFNMRLIVIYTCDVKSAEGTMEMDCFSLRMEQVFLAHIDGSAALENIRKKLEVGKSLSDDDLMKLVILPLTVSGKEKKQDMLRAVVELADKVRDESQKLFIISGVLVASDKFIDKEFMETMRRRINLTQIGLMYEKEKIEYAEQYATQYANEKVLKEKLQTAKSLMEDGVELVKIMKATGLTEAELIALQ